MDVKGGGEGHHPDTVPLGRYHGAHASSGREAAATTASPSLELVGPQSPADTLRTTQAASQAEPTHRLTEGLADRLQTCAGLLHLIRVIGAVDQVTHVLDQVHHCKPIVRPNGNTAEGRAAAAMLLESNM